MCQSDAYYDAKSEYLQLKDEFNDIPGEIQRCREKIAKLTNDKAYFAGVKEIAFMRDRYSVSYDSPLYIEGAGDNLNTERNDFVQNGLEWVTHES